MSNTALHQESSDKTYLSRIHSLIGRYFSLEEVRILCYVLGVDYDSIPGESKSVRIWELIFYLERRDRLQELVAQAKRERPNVAWPTLPDDLALAESLEPANKGSGEDTTVNETHVNIDIGGVGRDQRGMIAGGDVKNVELFQTGDVKDLTIIIDGQPTSTDKQPSLEKFDQLLADIQQEIAEIVKQQDILAEVDPSAPFIAQGAEQSINSVAEQVEPEMDAEEAESIQKSLTSALILLTGILDRARVVAKKTDEVGEAVMTIVKKLEPLVNKLGIVALWTAKLWLMD